MSFWGRRYDGQAKPHGLVPLLRQAHDRTERRLQRPIRHDPVGYSLKSVQIDVVGVLTSLNSITGKERLLGRQS